MLHYQRTQLKDFKEDIRQPDFGRILYILEFVEKLHFLLGSVFRFGDFADYNTSHECIIITLGSFLAANDNRRVHLVVFYLLAGCAFTLLSSIAIIYYSFKCLELYI